MTIKGACRQDYLSSYKPPLLSRLTRPNRSTSSHSGDSASVLSRVCQRKSNMAQRFCDCCHPRIATTPLSSAFLGTAVALTPPVENKLLYGRPYKGGRSTDGSAAR
jgi:hypothetical protein